MALPEDIALDLSDVTLDTLTLDDLEALEDITGRPFDEVFVKGRPKAKALKALAFISLRRDHPELTLEDVGSIAVVTGDAPDPAAEPVDPTDAAAS